MVLTSSKYFIQEQNHMFKLTAQSIMDGSRHLFTKTSINHVLQLIWICVSTFWIHNFSMKNSTKPYSQQVHTHSSNLTQNYRTPKSSMGERKEKHLHPYLIPQKLILRLKGIQPLIGPPFDSPYHPLIPKIGSTIIKINNIRKLSFSFSTNNSHKTKLVWQRT